MKVSLPFIVILALHLTPTIVLLVCAWIIWRQGKPRIRWRF